MNNIKANKLTGIT